MNEILKTMSTVVLVSGMSGIPGGVRSPLEACIDPAEFRNIGLISALDKGGCFVSV